MGIGVGIFLIAIGGVLTFAVNATANGINIHSVGVILMLAGLLGIVVDLAIFAPRRRTDVVVDRPVQQDVVTRTTRSY